MKPPRFRKTSRRAIAGPLPAVRFPASFRAIPAIRSAAVSLVAIATAGATAVADASVVAGVALVAVRIRAAAVCRVIRAAATRARRGVARAVADVSAVAVGADLFAFRILTVTAAAGAPGLPAALTAVGIRTTLGVRSAAVAVAFERVGACDLVATI